jgi:hypothetical protein
MRQLIALLVVTGAVALGSPAVARNLTLPKTSSDALHSACDAAGGKFSLGPRGYGCGTNCKGGPGTDCIVHCKADRKCTAQVIGSRRPHSVADALTKPKRHRT